MKFATAPAAAIYHSSFDDAQRAACFAVNATACAYYNANTGPELAITNTGVWLEFHLTETAEFKTASKLAQPKISDRRRIGCVTPGVYSGFQSRIGVASYADRCKHFATQAEAVAYVADWVARRYTVTVVAAVSPRQHVAAEIAAAAQHLNEVLLAGDLLDIELAEGRIYRASLTQVLTHVSHHGQRCAVLAIAGTLLTIDYNGQPVAVRSGSLLVAGFEFEPYEPAAPLSVDAMAAALTANGIFIGGLTDDAIAYYYGKLPELAS